MSKLMNEWIEAYQKKDALWIHDGNPKRPHALLTSGNHSNGFFNSRLVIQDEELLREAAYDLLLRFEILGGRIGTFDGIVGPQTGATKLAELISKEIRSHAKRDPFWASPAKHEEKGKKSMVFSEEEHALLYSRPVLLCEDVLTTGGSVDLAAEAVAEAGGMSIAFLLVLVNRSGLSEVSGKKIVALIDREMPMWTPEECPLCKRGSEAIRPKDNWALLNAAY